MASSPKKSSSSSTRPPIVKFACRTSSDRIQSLMREDELDLGNDFGNQNYYMNYTVMMPPTPDNQPMGGGGAGTGLKLNESHLKQSVGQIEEEVGMMEGPEAAMLGRSGRLRQAEAVVYGNELGDVGPVVGVAIEAAIFSALLDEYVADVVVDVEEANVEDADAVDGGDGEGAGAEVAGTEAVGDEALNGGNLGRRLG